jgi:hypothetical protein
VTSPRKRRANRRNARASTGPRTAAGKARAAQNARKHGLRVPALRDPAMAKNIGELARKLAGPAADAQRFEGRVPAGCRADRSSRHPRGAPASAFTCARGSHGNQAPDDA